MEFGHSGQHVPGDVRHRCEPGETHNPHSEACAAVRALQKLKLRFLNGAVGILREGAQHSTSYRLPAAERGVEFDVSPEQRTGADAGAELRRRETHKVADLQSGGAVLDSGPRLAEQHMKVRRRYA